MIETAGAVVSLVVLSEPEMTVPATVCEAFTSTVPSGRLRTSTPLSDQLPPLQATVLLTLPMATVTVPPVALQVPETPL